MLRLRLEWAREAGAKGLPPNAAIIDSLPRGVRRPEEEALRRIWPRLGTCCLYGTSGGVLVGSVGVLIGATFPHPQGLGSGGPDTGPFVGGAVGCVAGTVIGMAIGTSQRARLQARQHRSRVNDLIRRVNLALVAEP